MTCAANFWRAAGSAGALQSHPQQSKELVLTTKTAVIELLTRKGNFVNRPLAKDRGQDGAAGKRREHHSFDSTPSDDPVPLEIERRLRRFFPGTDYVSQQVCLCTYGTAFLKLIFIVYTSKVCRCQSSMEVDTFFTTFLSQPREESSLLISKICIGGQMKALLPR